MAVQPSTRRVFKKAARTWAHGEKYTNRRVCEQCLAASFWLPYNWHVTASARHTELINQACPVASWESGQLTTGFHYSWVSKGVVRQVGRWEIGSLLLLISFRISQKSRPDDPHAFGDWNRKQMPGLTSHQFLMCCLKWKPHYLVIIIILIYL